MSDIGALIAAGEVQPPEMFLLRLRAEELTLRRPTSDFDSMESLEASTDTILYPHQVHAAHFAVSNPMLRGVLLADEVGLGKTIEAGMIIKETVYRGARNVLVLASRSLCQQWAGELAERFDLHFRTLDSRAVGELEREGADPYSGFRITTYHYVNFHLGEFMTTAWDLVVIDECHNLKNPQGALHTSIKRLPRKFTCLATATPIQNYLPELHSISTLIDEQALGTAFSFRDKFCEDDRGLRPKNVHELKERLSHFAMRTLRSDVPEIKFTDRIPKLFNFDLYEDERRLYEGVSDYLARPNWAFGDDAAGKYLILLVYRKLLASSSFALRNALHKVVLRLEATKEGREEEPLDSADLGADVAASAASVDLEQVQAQVAATGDAIAQSIEQELEEVRGYVRLCESIRENAKGVRLVEAMPDLLEYGDRVLIFTQYKATQAYLARKLRDAGYETVEYSGDLTTHPNPDKDEREQAKRRFRDQADVMIATDAGAEGINLQFCHIVVNYDLPWNPMKIEQRIGRSHRIGQEHDVVVVNLVATGNAVDARLVELLTDKIHLFDSVLGGTDEILGAIEDGMDFERRVFEILHGCRTPQEIEGAFDELQRELEDLIEERRAEGTSLLRGGFDERLRDHLAVTERETRRALDRRTTMLRDFILGSLEFHGAKVREDDGVSEITTPSQYFLHSSELIDPEYRGSFSRDADPSVAYFSKRHPLIETALSYHLDRGRRSAITLAYTGNHNIHGVDELVGSEGWWLNFKVTFSGFEDEDHLLSVVLVHEDGALNANDLLSENAARITAEPMPWVGAMPKPDAELIERWFGPQVEALRESILERNAGYYLERRAVLDEYYGAKGDGEVLAERRHQVDETQRQITELDDRIERATAMTAKVDLMRQRDDLEERLFDLQSRMQAEQLEYFKQKRRGIEELEELRELQSEAHLINVAQWRLV